MKLRTSRELKNIILSINLAILTFFKFFVNFLKHFRVGSYENIFIFFWKTIKIAGSAQKDWKHGYFLLRPKVGAASFVDSVLRYTAVSSWRTAYIPIIDQVSYVGLLKN